MRGNYKTIKKLICGKIREFVLMPTYDGDIKELWQEWTDDKDSYYVYSYGKIIKGVFKHRYIGIGAFDRYKKARRHNTPLMGNMRENKYYKIIVSKTQTRGKAGILESCIIKKIGRKDLRTGDLYNLSNGGEAGTTGYIHSEETKRKMSEKRRGGRNAMWKDKSHITDQLLFKFLQSCKSWKKEIPSEWGISNITLHKMFKKRYGTGSVVNIQRMLAEKLGKRVLNHENFIQYCQLHKYEFLQMANYYFGISGEQLQRWCLRTYKSAKTQTINGWGKCAKRMEKDRQRQEIAQKRTSKKQ